jgi:integrase
MKIEYKWKSGIALEAQNYISLKRQCGYKFEVQERCLRHFDTFLYRNGHEGIILTQEIVNGFIYTENERPSSQYYKEVVMRDFAKYLVDKNYNAYICEITTKLPRCKFVPHIFSDLEISRLFTAIDKYPQTKKSIRNSVDPVLFRFLYSTGVRISEALSIVISDLDLKMRTVNIKSAKNCSERLLPLDDNMMKRIISYLNNFHLYSQNNTWLFPSYYNGLIGQMHRSTAYNHFRDYLVMAEIPHTEIGPRIHSFRHTFAVKNLKKWALSGEDINTVLPYLTAYMGHSDFRGTQYYLRLTADLYPEILQVVENQFGYVIPECEEFYEQD